MISLQPQTRLVQNLPSIFMADLSFSTKTPTCVLFVAHAITQPQPTGYAIEYLHLAGCDCLIALKLSSPSLL